LQKVVDKRHLEMQKLPKSHYGDPYMASYFFLQKITIYSNPLVSLKSLQIMVLETNGCSLILFFGLSSFAFLFANFGSRDLLSLFSFHYYGGLGDESILKGFVIWMDLILSLPKIFILS
jgi:hypothetical protein